MYTSVQFKCLLARCLNINGVLINFSSSSRERESLPSLTSALPPSLLLSLLVRLYPPLSGDALPWAKRRISHGALPATWRALTVSTFSAFPLRWRELVFRPALPQGLIQLHFLSEHFKMPVLPLLSFLLVFLSAAKWLDCIFLFNTACNNSKKKRYELVLTPWLHSNSKVKIQLLRYFMFGFSHSSLQECFCGEKSSFAVHRSSAWLSFCVN